MHEKGTKKLQPKIYFFQEVSQEKQKNVLA
jgi:hypothetical protein